MNELMNLLGGVILLWFRNNRFFFFFGAIELKNKIMATKDFITYSPNTGNKKQTISVTASKNISSERNTVLSISAKGITKTININQKKGISVAVIVGQNGNIFKIQLEWK